MRRLRGLAVLISLVGVLAACNIVIQLPFPVTPTPVSANNPSGSSSALATFTLAPGNSVYYEIDVSSSQKTGYDVLQAEIDQNFHLTLYNASGSALASSTSPAYFASGTLGLTSLGATSLAPQSITVNPTCAGSCVVQKLTDTVYYVQVENQTSTAQTVHLYGFVRYYDDPYEPGNDVRSGAITLAPGSTGDSGALETLGDQDYWQMGATGTLSFDATNSVQERADVFDNAGTFLTTLLPGDTYSVAYGDLVRVYASGNQRAAVAGASVYYLTLQ